MAQHAFFFNGERCTGCRTCQLACADYNDLDSDHWYRKVYEFGDGSWQQDGDGCWTTDTFTYHVTVACNHCDDPACVKVCPTGAMHKEQDTGFVRVDSSRCIGCGYCAMACPYGAPTVDRQKGHSVKCDGCADRVALGLKPICVEACPLHALDFGAVEEISALGGRADFAPLPSATLTSPNLFAVEPANAQPSDGYAGSVKNLAEVM